MNLFVFDDSFHQRLDMNILDKGKMTAVSSDGFLFGLDVVPDHLRKRLAVMDHTAVPDDAAVVSHGAEGGVAAQQIDDLA